MKNERKSFRERKSEGRALLEQGGRRVLVGSREAELFSVAEATRKGGNRNGRS